MYICYLVKYLLNFNSCDGVSFCLYCVDINVNMIVCFSCFERFFKHVNMKENKLIQKRRGGYMMEDLELVGYDYLWRVSIYAAYRKDLNMAM